MVVLLIELYPFIPFAMTLIVFIYMFSVLPFRLLAVTIKYVYSNITLYGTILTAYQACFHQYCKL